MCTLGSFKTSPPLGWGGMALMAVAVAVASFPPEGGGGVWVGEEGGVGGGGAGGLQQSFPRPSQTPRWEAAAAAAL